MGPQRGSKFPRSDLIRVVTIVLAAAAIAALWIPWSNPGLDKPTADFAQTFRVGIGDAPSDTRVFFNLDPWSPYPAARPIRLVLGQSHQTDAASTRFRIEVRGFIAPIPADECLSQRTESTCWDGDGSVTEQVRESTTILSGEFAPGGFLAIEFGDLRLGASSNGPYRSLLIEFLELEEDAELLAYPTRGIEVEVSTGLENNAARYDSFVPAQPYRFYPAGWAWLLAAPGGPIGVQITDTELEDTLIRRSQISGLFLGLAAALLIQAAYELIHVRLTRQDERAH